MSTDQVPDGWREHLLEERERKDEFLREHPQSPLPEGAREEFEGLPYFEPDPSLRFELELHEHDPKERLTVATTAGGEQEYLRWGEFRFEVEGEPVTLQAYRSDPEEDRLWVPFRDETNGEETYGGGRYLDLEREAHRASDGASGRRPRGAEDRVDGKWVLDLNRAYSPYCAYNAAYECPMVPTENWLDVPVEAGEKLPDLPGDAGH